MGLISRVSSRTYSLDMNRLFHVTRARIVPSLPIRTIRLTAFDLKPKRKRRVPTKTGKMTATNAGSEMYRKFWLDNKAQFWAEHGARISKEQNKTEWSEQEMQ